MKLFFRRTLSLATALLLAVNLLSGCAQQTAQPTATPPAPSPSAAQEGADYVITNASIYTADEQGTTATALAITDGIITYVGDDASAYIAEDTTVMDAGGGTVMPGLIDAHMHPAYNAVSFMYEIYLGELGDLDGYLAAIADFVATHPDDTSYAGTGFSRSVWDSVGPRKESLDAICDDRPIIIRSGDGHSYWVNSYVLEQAGITKDTPDPEGGIIQRDPVTGEPSGLLQESGAMDLVANQKRAYTLEEYKEAILWVQEWFAEMGITTVFDAMIPLDNPNYYMAYQELAQEGKLTVRIRGAWHLFPEMAGSVEELEAIVDKGIALSQGFTTDYFQVGAFKFFADQVLEEATAYLTEPYSDRTDGWQGLKVWDDEVMARLFTKIDKAGFQIHTHQIGDAAATYTLDAIEKAVAANGPRDSRHTFAHVQLISDRDAQRLADLNMCAIIAPYWMQGGSYYEELYVPYLGRERAERMYPAKSLLEKGIHVSTHSDFAVSIPNATELFYASMTRTITPGTFEAWYGEGSEYTRSLDFNATDDTGTVLLPLPKGEEALTMDEAVIASTREGAYAHFLEGETGSIVPGKKADLMIFQQNIFTLDMETMSQQAPLMTMFEGAVVYDSRQAP